MAINPINNTYTPSTQSVSAYSKKGTETATDKKAAQTTAASGVVYEKSADSTTDRVEQRDNSAIIAQMQADAEQRTAQLRSLVEKMMSQQGLTIAKADDMWSFLAEGNFTVDAATKAQAEADIAEDGYWGVEQTSNRILDFAKALSGDNPEMADKLLDAFKEGFQAATKSWGKDLPDLSKRTYDAVLEKFDRWKNGTEETDQKNAAQTEKMTKGQ
ncbi:MAG: hypothetical protein ACI4DR_10430 [Roseburia sp.]